MPGALQGLRGRWFPGAVVSGLQRNTKQSPGHRHLAKTRITISASLRQPRGEGLVAIEGTWCQGGERKVITEGHTVTGGEQRKVKKRTTIMQTHPITSQSRCRIEPDGAARRGDGGKWEMTTSRSIKTEKKIVGPRKERRQTPVLGGAVAASPERGGPNRGISEIQQWDGPVPHSKH